MAVLGIRQRRVVVGPLRKSPGIAAARDRYVFLEGVRVLGRYETRDLT